MTCDQCYSRLCNHNPSEPKATHGLEELVYPFHDRTITVTKCGRICFNQKKINFSTVFAG